MNARGGCFVLGRSDATLNRHGVRIGTAEVYRSLLGVPEVEDALIVNLDLPGGKFFMPLFVKLKADQKLDESVESRIRTQIRNEYSPRHVPDRIIQVRAILYTLTGKKMEVPVRRILMEFRSKRRLIALRWPTSRPSTSTSTIPGLRLTTSYPARNPLKM